VSNDNGLVDEYSRLQTIKKEIALKEHDLKQRIIALAKEKNTETLFGTKIKCTVKEFTKVIYPEDKEEFIALIRKKGLYERFSSVNYLKLNPAIIKGEIDKEIATLTRLEKDVRLSVKEI
jgi:hypothetical protein